jgi:hypothetical protein
VRRGAVIGAAVTLTGTSRLYDLVSERVREGTADEPHVVPERAVVIPGSRILPGTFAHKHGLSATTAVNVKTRDAGSYARVAREAAL